MKVEEKISALAQLGDYIEHIYGQEPDDLFLQAESENPWFIRPFIKSALHGISRLLRKDHLEKWMGTYPAGRNRNYRIGLILAGNIPLVGFHDLMCVLLSDHIACVKPSHLDRVLITSLMTKLSEIEPRFGKRMQIMDSMKNPDAIIATGSDNSARYFSAYYRKFPHLIRKNRTSVAILEGNEHEEDLTGLSDDIFLYFGLGCRNVSKVYLPDNYDPAKLVRSLQSKNWMGDHSKYYHNYIYQKSLSRMINQETLDGGFFMMEKSEKLVSPVSTLYYAYYSNLRNLQISLSGQMEKIQSIVTGIPSFKNRVPFGRAQFPDPWDYADQVDTLNFLLHL